MKNQKPIEDSSTKPAPSLPDEAIPVWLHPSFVSIPDDTSLSEYED